MPGFMDMMGHALAAAFLSYGLALFFVLLLYILTTE